MKTPLRTLLTAIPLFFGACAPSFHAAEAPSAVEVKTTTPEPEKPIVTQAQGYRIARGATRIHDMLANYDAKTKAMTLTGKVEYTSVKGGAVETINVDLTGLLDKNGFITLKALPTSAPLREGVVMAAKATCLSELGTCHSSFIDIYISTQGIVYHHQVESHQEPEKKPEVKEEPKKVRPKDQRDDPEPLPRQDNDEETEFEGHNEVEDEPGQFVGTVHEDIENLLNIKPEPEAPAEPMPEEPTEEPKKETPAPTPTPPKDRVIPYPMPPLDRTKPRPEPTPETKPEEPKPEPEKPTTPVTDPSTIKKVSQAVGAVNSGRLENATDVYKYERAHKDVGFHIIRPERYTHFATNELAYIVQQIGLQAKQLVPGYVVPVGDLSRETGGKLGRHKSHTNGLDGDIGFFFTNKSFRGHFTSAVAVNKSHGSWMVKEQWALYKKLVSTQLIDRIFIHEILKKEICRLAIASGEIDKDTREGVPYQTLRRLIADQDHNTHFHVRVKCSSAQIRCRQMPDPVHGTGCF